MHRPPCATRLRAGVTGLLGALLALPAPAQQPSLQQLRIESDPPGAEVLLIGGSAGHTPLSVGERAIYPNDYSDEQAPLYGLVTLRRAGCATHVQRVTLEDIERGMHVTLDCDPAVAMTESDNRSRQCSRRQRIGFPASTEAAAGAAGTVRRGIAQRRGGTANPA